MNEDNTNFKHKIITNIISTIINNYSMIINILFLILTISILITNFMDTIILQLLSLFTTLCIYFTVNFVIKILCRDIKNKQDIINKLEDNKSEPIFKQDNDENQLSLF